MATSRGFADRHIPVRAPTVDDESSLGIGITSKWTPEARRSGTIRLEPSSIASLPWANHSSGECLSSCCS